MVKSILSSLEIEILDEKDGVLTLSVPTYRVDVQRDVDVIEDILRIYGYNNVEFTDSVHSNLSYKTMTDENHRLYNLIAEQLTGCGFNEIMNNSLTKSAYYTSLTTYPEKNCVPLLNPLSNDLNVMRQTLLFGGLESLAYNINRRRPDLKFYEFGNCYNYDADADTSKNVLASYSEAQHLGLWITGNRVSGSWAHPDEKSSVFELKGYVENIFARLGVDMKKLQFSQISDDIFDVALVYTMRNGGKILAKFGLVSKKILKLFDIETGVSYAEMNWTLLVKEAVKNKVTFSEISKFPPVKRDLALLVDTSVQFAEIEKVAYDTERRLLKDVYLFDVYEGKNLESGKKSYAVSFILQDETKTLNDKQIESIMNRIIANLQQKLNAKLR